MSAVLEQTPMIIQPLKAVQPVIVAASNTAPVAKRVNMSNEDYHADKSAISSTSLKELLRSPMHFWHSQTAPRVEKEHFRFGTAIHAYLLEQDRFLQEYVVTPEKGKTKASKEAYEEFLKAHPDCQHFVSESEMTMILGIADQVGNHASASELIKLGQAEQSFFWTDEETGILCKVRTDLLCVPFAILDVKSTTNASPEAFQRDVAKFNYDLSAAMYQEGVYRVTGEKLDFAWLAVEKEAPHGVALYNAEDFLETGYKKFRRALRLLKSCRESLQYPGYQPDGIAATLPRPGWYK